MIVNALKAMRLHRQRMRKRRLRECPFVLSLVREHYEHYADGLHWQRSLHSRLYQLGARAGRLHLAFFKDK
jgi:hypothetical protein